MRCTDRQRQGSTTLVTVRGTTGLGDMDSDVTRTVTEIAAGAARRVVLDLAGVSSLDSHELGDLVGAQEAARRHDCCVELRNVQPRVREVLVTMSLAKVFDLDADER